MWLYNANVSSEGGAGKGDRLKIFATWINSWWIKVSAGVALLKYQPVRPDADDAYLSFNLERNAL